VIRDQSDTLHHLRAHISHILHYNCAQVDIRNTVQQKIITPTIIFPFLIPLFLTIFPSTVICRSLLSEYVQSFHCYDYYCLCCFLSSLLLLLLLLLLLSALLSTLILLLLIIIIVVFLVDQWHCDYYCYMIKKASAKNKEQITDIQIIETE